MRTLVRFIVMWFIAVALPLQGVAAATMLHCGPEERSEIVLHHNHRTHAETGDEAQASAAAIGPFAHADEPSLNHDHHAHHASSCSVCASCCSAAAFPAVSWLLPTLDATQAVASLAAAPPAAFLTGGPERPPRCLLA